MAGRPKGLPKTGGRVKGKSSEKTRILREMVLMALEGVGGITYLQTQASENPASFMTLLGKVLPLQLVGPGDGPLQVTTIDYATALAAQTQPEADEQSVH